MRKLGLDVGLSFQSPRKKQNYFQQVKNIIEVGMYKLHRWTREETKAISENDGNMIK